MAPLAAVVPSLYKRSGEQEEKGQDGDLAHPGRELS